MLAHFTTEARRHRDKTMILQLRAGAERAIQETKLLIA